MDGGVGTASPYTACGVYCACDALVGCCMRDSGLGCSEAGVPRTRNTGEVLYTGGCPGPVTAPRRDSGVDTALGVAYVGCGVDADASGVAAAPDDAAPDDAGADGDCT